MSSNEVDEKSSIAQSEQSEKTNSPTTNPQYPFADLNLKTRHGTFVNKVFNVVWRIVVCLIVSCSFIGFVELSKLAFVRSSSNSTVTVFPPAFLTYFSTFWILLIYPINCVTQICRHGNNNKELNFNLRHNLMLLFPVKSRWCRHGIRMAVLIILWNILVYCIIRSAHFIDAVDVMVLFCTNSSITYLIHWVMMHKKFIALRVIAFILSSSGMIINVYINADLMWYKVMCATATVAYSSFYSYSKSLIVAKNAEQALLLYSVLASLNIIFMWPISLFTSVVTSAETITWNSIPWNYFIGCGVALLLTIMSMEISHITSSRGARNVLLLVIIPITYIIDIYWLKTLASISNLQIISLVLVSLSVFLTSFPSSWMRACSVKYIKKPTPVRSRRVSISARMNLVGNGGDRLSASQGGHSGSISSHRDSMAIDMINKIGSIGNHIFSARTRNRLNSVFAS